MPAIRCLIVEDEVISALSLRMELEEHGYEVVGSITSGEKAVEAVDELKPDVVIMDVHLDGETDGLKAAGIIKKRWGIPVLFFTGFDVEPLQASLSTVNPIAVLEKPVRIAEIDEILRTKVKSAK